MIFFGIDNGTSGSLAYIRDDGSYWFEQTPIKYEQSYTKVKQNISRIDYPKLVGFFTTAIDGENVDHVRVLLERPMINPIRFKASISASRSLEATVIALEQLGISYQYIDSKQWQKDLLPSMPQTTKDGAKIPQAKRSKALKEASLNIGKRLFPNVAEGYGKDADGMLIAEYCRRFFK